MNITAKTQNKILNALYELETYMMDSEVLHDVHHMYSAEDRREHNRAMKKVGRLISKLSIKEG
jgi:hypothetical protein